MFDNDNPAEELTAGPTLTPAPVRVADRERIRSARNQVQGQEQVVRAARAALQEAKRAHQWHGVGRTEGALAAAEARLRAALDALAAAEKRLDEVLSW